MSDQRQIIDIILEPSLSEREDLDHLFLMDDGDIAMQQKLDIETYEEAKSKGYFVPKPRQGDVHKSLRSIRRVLLKSHEFGLLNYSDLERLIHHLVTFLRAGDDSYLQTELKKFLYVLIAEKKYAETIEGETTELLALSLERCMERIPLSWNTRLKDAQPEDIYLALQEICDEWFPIFEDERKYPRNPNFEADVKEKFPHFFKVMLGDDYVIFSSKEAEEAYLRTKKKNNLRRQRTVAVTKR